MPSFAPAGIAPLAPDAGPPPFPRILCGINAYRSAQEAAREATALAAGGGALHFLAISDGAGEGATRAGLLTQHRAELALAKAREVAGTAGIAATSEQIADTNAVGRLLAESRGHDLLVVGSPIRSRAAGMLLGEAAGVALHRCGVPVLLAPPAAADAPFPARVLVATDAGERSREAVVIGARIAQRHGVPLTLLHVADALSSEQRHELTQQAVTAKAITGIEPIVLARHGHPVARIIEVAGDHEGTLLVMGSTGRKRLASLASVGERVGARASGPVLVLRPAG